MEVRREVIDETDRCIGLFTLVKSENDYFWQKKQYYYSFKYEKMEKLIITRRRFLEAQKQYEKQFDELNSGMRDLMSYHRPLMIPYLDGDI